jgi:hypothetical protein
VPKKSNLHIAIVDWYAEWGNLDYGWHFRPTEGRYRYWHGSGWSDTAVNPGEEMPYDDPAGRPATTSTTTAILAPIELSGHGDTVLDLPTPSARAVLLHVVHTGEGYFNVGGLDQNLQLTNVLVHAVGAFNGVVPLNFDSNITTRLQVQSTGDFQIIVMDPSMARRLDKTITGRGADVLAFTGPGVATLTHDGQSNFQVVICGRDRTDLLVNEIGPYEGQVPFSATSAWLFITADGNWTINIG